MTTTQLPGNNIDAHLNTLGNELDQLRTETRQASEEAPYNSQIISPLQGTVTELLVIALLHQQALRISERNAEQDKKLTCQLLIEVREIGIKNQRILEHLFYSQD